MFKLQSTSGHVNGTHEMDINFWIYFSIQWIANSFSQLRVVVTEKIGQVMQKSEVFFHNMKIIPVHKIPFSYMHGTILVISLVSSLCSQYLPICCVNMVQHHHYLIKCAHNKITSIASSHAGIWYQMAQQVYKHDSIHMKKCVVVEYLNLLWFHTNTVTKLCHFLHFQP